MYLSLVGGAEFSSDLFMVELGNIPPTPRLAAALAVALFTGASFQ